MGTLLRKKVLIIDDREELCLTMKERLKDEGFEADYALDSLRGLEKIHTYKPDVVLLDLLLPKMNGWEVCKKIRSSAGTEKMKIYILSAHEPPDFLGKVREAGAQEGFIKPYDTLNLIQTLKQG